MQLASYLEGATDVDAAAALLNSLQKHYVVGTEKNHHSVMVLFSTHQMLVLTAR